LETTGLTDLVDKPAGVLAHGQKQWLEIGMLLVQNADVLLLDEPVAGMSHEEREETGNLLRRIGGERTVVVVEHDMDFLRAFATSVTVLARGQVIAEGSVAEVQANPKVQEVYLGTAAAGADGIPDELIEESS
jgi:urea transport system ATP-binding protein